MTLPAWGVVGFVVAAALALGALPAQALGCTQAEPCAWPITLDDTGFDTQGVSAGGWNFTAGTWVQVQLLNLDNRSHVITIQPYGRQLHVAAEDQTVSEPFNLTAVGTFLVRVDTTAALGYRVTRADIVDESQGLAPSTTRRRQEAAGFGDVGLLVAMAGALCIAGHRDRLPARRRSRK